MNPKRAHDLPDFRLWLLEQWQGPFMMMNAVAEAYNPVGIGPEFSRIDERFDARYLRSGGLWWVTADMVTLIDRASKSLPPTTLAEDLLPAPEGFMMLETALEGSDSESGESIGVRGFLWGDALLRKRNRRFLGISLYGVGDRTGMVLPVGRTDWEFGVDTEAPTTKELAGDEVRLASMAEDRRWFATLCLLLATSSVASHESVPAPRPVARRSLRAKVTADVRLVDVIRRPSASSDGSGSVEWSHRWIVGGDTGGFWRQQAYGPGHTLRRPVWIAPHVKGPADKPLVVKDTVHVLRPPPAP